MMTIMMMMMMMMMLMIKTMTMIVMMITTAGPEIRVSVMRCVQGYYTVQVYMAWYYQKRGDSRTKEHKRNNAGLTLESFVFLCTHFCSCAKSMESVKLEGQRKVLT